MDNNIEEKLRNLEEWNKERARIKPFIDMAVDYHNKARAEVRWKNYDRAAHLYKEAIKNYKSAIGLNPKYYLQDLLKRIDRVIEEHINNSFNLVTSDDKLKTEDGISKFLNFIDRLKEEEGKYIDSYDISQAFFRIADLYYEEGDLKRAREFYGRVINTCCTRPFINRDAYFKIGRILFDQKKFKEALIAFVSVLSFDRENSEVVVYIRNCLRRLGISEYLDKFLVATPNEARKLIMEVL